MERLRDLFFPKRALCLICEEERKADSFICSHCQERFEIHRGIREVGSEQIPVYDSLVYNRFFRARYAEYKFQGKNFYDRVFAQYLVKTYKDNGLDVDILVYVPMHFRAECERGYNQSALLAKEIGHILQIPVASAVQKKMRTCRQIDMDLEGRRRNLQGAFSIVDPNSIYGKKVLVIDDIITTGATLSEVFRVMSEKEPASLAGLVLASSKI